MGTQRYLSDKAFLKAIVATAFLVAVALGAWAQLLPRER